MKYWWLEKYKNFKIVQISELYYDVHYFITMPKNYEKQYQSLKDKNIDDLLEEELLILLYNIVTTKNIKNNHLNVIIEKLLETPDNSFPSSDYSLKEMLDEIKNLKANLPYREKLDTNNIAICYHCLNIFYVDKIKKINKNNLCLCPYCLSHGLYFDNDYIPMNYIFIKLAQMYHYTSLLGCSFKNIQKIIKKNVSTKTVEKPDNSIVISYFVFNNKILPIDEKIISRNLMLNLYKYENNLDEVATIYISDLDYRIIDELMMIILVTIMETLSNTIYLKKIILIFNNDDLKKKFDCLLRVINTFK